MLKSAIYYAAAGTGRPQRDIIYLFPSDALNMRCGHTNSGLNWLGQTPLNVYFRRASFSPVQIRKGGRRRVLDVLPYILRTSWGAKHAWVPWRPVQGELTGTQRGQDCASFFKKSWRTARTGLRAR